MNRSPSAFESVSGKVDVDFPAFGAEPADALVLASTWLEQAELENVREPRSMTFSTFNTIEGITSRVMAALELSAMGLTFATHRTSTKARDIKSNGAGCAHFYWRELGRQLCLTGTVTELSNEISDSVWNKRPVPLHAMSVASHQSEELNDPASLLARAQELSKAGPLPRPAHFAVYCLYPLQVEFWGLVQIASTGG